MLHRVLPVLICLGVTAIVVTVFLHSVDLKPQVGEKFFFSKDDPQVRSDNEISRTFPGQLNEIDLTVSGDIASETYADRIHALSIDLEKVPGVTAVISIDPGPKGHGPKDLKDALKSPLWTNILIGNDHRSTAVIATVKDDVGAKTIDGVQALKTKFDRPGFEVMIAGLPYVTEMISRTMARDLRTFSLAAVGVFGVVLFLLFRSPWILLGAFVACANSSLATLIMNQKIRIPIGPITANLSTMVFVMTLSPMVFLTYNWIRIREQTRLTGLAAAWAAVKETVVPSFWSAVCMLLGFISLMLVSATSMKHLGMGGAVGAAMAFLAAYLLYPWFLALASPPKREFGWTKAVTSWLRSFFSERHRWLALAVVIFGVVAALGLPRLNTDPPLFFYFQKGSDIRQGLEAVDRSGGSSPLKLEIEDRHGAPLDTNEAYKRLWALNDALEKDPAVGKAMSLPVMESEIDRRWYSKMLSIKGFFQGESKKEEELGVLESPKHGAPARQFITPDHKKVLFLLRMRETARNASRQEVIRRVEGIVHREGFRTLLVGGEYSLLGDMGRLIKSSMITSSLLLIGIFAVMGFAFSRSWRTGLAMLITLAIIPVVVRGYIAYLGMPLGFITATAANLDLGMGVDAMIYLTVFAKRANKNLSSWEPWSNACSHLWRPIGTNFLVICCGFGIFLLSNFPPTLRFGVFVIFGSATAASAALFLFPWLASVPLHKQTKRVEGKELKTA
ncbi:MAG TPA: MMPL family transporter [Bryobacteraceae bacterium]|jgi:predicted RND superfamily exporter protein|nr:MMPL family transporter [Bryobacteraceae bacterium]